MNKRTLITFLCFSAIIPMMAQDIKGKIVDEKGEPLAFANVVLLNRQDSAFVKGVVSGEDGHFAINSACNNGIIKVTSKRKGFQLGIDDYMVKPIELDELLLRVRALLRRANIEMERKITVGNLILDADAMSAEIDGEEISLTTREFNIIYKLLSYPKKTFSRAQLMDEFWGVETDTSLRAVDVYVTKLRDKLSACDGFKIVTVRGLGYKVVLQ